MRPISTSDSLAMLFHLPVHVTLLFPILVTGAPRPQISADGYVCTADKTGFTRVGLTFACPTGTMCDSSVTAGSPCVASGQGVHTSSGSSETMTTIIASGGVPFNSASQSGGVGTPSIGSPSPTHVEQSATRGSYTSNTTTTFAFVTAIINTTRSSTSSAGGSSTAPLPSNSTGKRFVAYWSAWASPASAPTPEQLQGVTHLVLAFADMISWTGFVTSSQPFNQGTVNTYRKKGLKVMASFGGWNLDLPFHPAVQTDETRKAFAKHVGDLVTSFGLDGADMDWEFPGGDGANYMLPSSDPKFRGADPSDAEKYVQLLAEIKTALDGKELSISVPSRPLDRRLYTADVAQGIDSLVDWWNVMTYDYVNRRDTQTNFHTGGVVVADTLAYYSGFGIKTSRMVIGFALYAKWFILNGADSASCSASKPIGCRMGGYEDSTGADDGQSGSWTFNQQLNPTTNATVAASYQSIPSSGTNISDPKQMSSAFYDSAHHIFWTWASPDDIKKTCQTYKDQVAGVGLWSLNQDIDAASGGDHIKAVADCMAS